MKKKILKSYARYDTSGRIIPGSNILAREKPAASGGKWIEGPATLCCTPPDGVCVTYQYSQIENASVLLSYTSCEGVATGPIGINGLFETVFCAISGTVVVDGRGGTLTYLETGCNYQ